MPIRRFAVLLAILAAVVQALLLVMIEQQVRAVSGVLGTGLQISGFRWVWIVLAPLPWAVGAALLLAGRAHLGTAVLVAAAALALPAALPAIVNLAAGAGAPARFAELAAAVGPPLVALLGLLAAGAALVARPRGGWRLAAPGPTGGYVTVAILAWLPTALQTLELSPPGAMRSFARTELSRLAGIEAVASVSFAVTVAALLFVAPRLRVDVAGAVVLVFAVPQLADAAGDLAQVRVTQDLILTPPAVLGDLGLLGITLLALWWLARAGRRLAVASSEDPVRPGGEDPACPDGDDPR